MLFSICFFFNMPISTFTPSAFVELPAAPLTTSKVPHLTSIHSTRRRGPWGDARYPGNCSGYLIKDLLMFFEPRTVFDPMTGSGTCADVCGDLGIECKSLDVKSGFDAADPACYQQLPRFDFVWLHPPYWRMKKYSDDPRCLSNCKDIADFSAKLQAVIENCANVLSDRGRIAILMGDYFDPIERRIIPCTHLTKAICLRTGLWPACTDIVRFQHGNSSSRKSYNSAFIPGLHDVCVVMQRQQSPHGKCPDAEKPSIISD